jgi:hypothetical protein
MGKEGARNDEKNKMGEYEKIMLKNPSFHQQQK